MREKSLQHSLCALLYSWRTNSLLYFSVFDAQPIRVAIRKQPLIVNKVVRAKALILAEAMVVGFEIEEVRKGIKNVFRNSANLLRSIFPPSEL